MIRVCIVQWDVDNPLSNDDHYLSEDAQDKCHNKSAFVSNMQVPDETPVPAPETSPSENHLKSDPPQGIEAESLHDRIVLLADSRREVADDQLPLNYDDQHRAIETGSQCHNNSPKKKNECLTDVNQQRPPSYPRNSSSPSDNAANQNDGSRINDMHPFRQSKKQLSSENKGQPREAYRERSYNHVPSKEKK